MPFPWRLHQTENPKSFAESKASKKPFFPQPANPITAFQSHPIAALKNQLESAVENFANQAKRALQLGLANIRSRPNRIPFFARVSPAANFDARGCAMPSEAVEERLSGVPVYALSNAAGEFVLVTGIRAGTSLGLLCFKRQVAEALLDQMQSMDHEMRQGSKVVAVALNKIFQLKVDGVAFRLIPDPEQVLNAAKLKEKTGMVVVDFPGVPVFQSRSLILRSGGKSYRPAFFRKRQLNPSFRKGDIDVSPPKACMSSSFPAVVPKFKIFLLQVTALEEIISAMQGTSTSDWDDIVFIPPGFDVAIAVREDKPIIHS